MNRNLSDTVANEAGATEADVVAKRPRARSRVSELAGALLTVRAAGWALVGVGVAVRLVRFAADRSLWGDEAMLALNITDRSARSLLNTLDYTQAAPSGFLLAEKLAVSLFGRTELALRLVPLLAGIAALFLFRGLAQRFLTPPGALVALGLFAVAEPLVYYSSEVKQYEVDVFAAVAVLAVAAPALESGTLSRGRALALGAAGVAAVWVSHPVIFVLAGIGTALIVAQLVSPERRLALPLAVSAAFAASFLVAYKVTVAQTAEVRSALRLDEPSARPNASGILRDAWNAIADPGPFARTSTALVAVLAILGVIWLARRKPWHATALMSALAALALAGVIGKYPLYGRFVLFTVPILLLLVGAGFDYLRATQRSPYPIAAALLLAGVALYPVAHEASRTLHPPGHEELRPVIGSLDKAWRPGDRLYVSRVAQFALRYYAECRACDGFSPGRDDLRTLVLSNRRQGRFALSSKPPRLVVGNVENGSPYERLHLGRQPAAGLAGLGAVLVGLGRFSTPSSRSTAAGSGSQPTGRSGQWPTYTTFARPFTLLATVHGASSLRRSRLAGEVRAHAGDDRCELLLGDSREDRQGEHLFRERLGDRESTAGVAEAGEGSRQMDRLGIVPPGRDPSLGEECAEPLRIRCPDHVQVPDGLAARGHGRRADVAGPLERLGVEARRGTPLLVPAVQERQLPDQGKRLDGVEAGRVADQVVPVLRPLAVLPQRSDALGQRLVVRDERACVAECAQVLGGIEAERTCARRGAGSEAVSARAVRLGGVFQHEQTVPVRKRAHGPDVCQLAVEVHRKQEPGSRPDGRLGRVDVEVQVGLAHVDGNRGGAGLHDRLERGDEGVRRHDHLVSRLDARGEQAEAKRIEAAAEPDAVRDPAVVRECLLELGDGRPVREGARLEQVGYVAEQVGRDLRV